MAPWVSIQGSIPGRSCWHCAGMLLGRWVLETCICILRLQVCVDPESALGGPLQAPFLRMQQQDP